jgi:hydroxypyruvate isomerase
MSRREWVGGAAGLAAAGLVAAGGPEVAEAVEGPARKGRIRQSMASWCFGVGGDKWDLEKQAQVARQLGLLSVELVEPRDFAVLKRHGLICAITPCGMPDPPFAKGWNNPLHHAELTARTTEAIDVTAAAGFPNVIAFTGYKWRNADDPHSGEISLEEGAEHCVAGLKQIAAHAEKRGVTLCVEMLNTRDSSHPMKGHPGYQGDHLDYVASIVQRVGSPRVKLLFDLYHVQVMDGDLVRRIRQYGEWIGHVHTAGNPGRGELDARQEINFAACMHALLEVGYCGYVGHEFIPTRDPLQGLSEAVTLCDVG